MPTPTPTIQPRVLPAQTITYTVAHEQHMVDLINDERTKVNEPPLTENQLLDNSATDKANDLCAKNYWSHVNPEGVTPWDMIRETGYDSPYLGENLAKGFYTDESAMYAFMHSEEHKANILEPHYTEVGIGKCGKYIVQHFGGR